MTIPEIGTAVPQRQNKLLRRFAAWLFHTLGWRYEGEFPNQAKMILVGAPHTSNWDFFLTLIIMFSLGIQMSWLGKHTFVNGPLRPLLTRLGGIPVDRRSSHGLVEQIVDVYQKRDKLLLAISPEGTRSKVQRWKTGFYYIALGAGVPILPVVADYKRKVVRLCAPLLPTGDVEADMALIKANYEAIQGKNPTKF